MSTPTRPPLAGSAINLTGSTPTLVRDDGIWFVPCGSDAADALARELRAGHRETGWWPLLTQEPEVEEIWDGSLQVDIPVGEAAVALIEGDATELLADLAEDLDLPEQVNVLPATTGPVDRIGGVEWTGVLLVPGRASWASLAFVGFGGFNDCPLPSEHGTVARWLFEAFGSDPIAVGVDHVLFRSLRPVAADQLTETVQALMSYCPELVGTAAEADELASLLAVGVTRLGLWWD